MLSERKVTQILLVLDFSVATVRTKRQVLKKHFQLRILELTIE